MKKMMRHFMALALCLMLCGALFVPARAAEATEEPVALLATQPTEEAPEDEVVLGPGKMLALTFGGIVFAGGTVIGGGMLFRAVKKGKFRKKK